MNGKTLPTSAYELKPGEKFVPLYYGQDLPELTIKAVLAGIILGIIFGAANTYLGLKVGLTISTSIPVAVLTVVAFRLFSAFGLRHSILEANMSQTIGSASSSVASGVLFTIPALFIWGMDPAWRQITLLAMCGGLLGVLAMIPLRRYLIKREHGRLPYPEGMACAEVLVASEQGGPQAAGVFWGLGAGMLFKLITDGKTFLPLIYGSSSGVFESLTTQGGGKFLSTHITDTGVYLTASISGGNSWPFISRIADITAPEDTTLAIPLQAFDPDGGDVLAFSAASDTPAVAVAIVVDTLKITPQLNWNGTAHIKVIVSDGNLKDTTDFVLTLEPVQDKPLAFNLTAPAKDSTVVIYTTNLTAQFRLQWDQAVDPEGDNVTYDVVYTDSLDIMPSKYIGGNEGIFWTLNEIKTIMETNSYATMSGTWTILARDQQDTTYATNGPFNLTFVNGTLGIDDGEGLPTAFALHQNYPNPFNPSTTVKFDVPEATELTVVVYDLLGRKVVTLVEGTVQPGYHRVIWSGKAADGSEVPTGIYIARLLTTGYTKSIKMLLLK
ncbi:MAG: OPT/YSL family transporter [Candidatus Marinimicrobia bacterium]|nr:OPT/YSL family transporter [Candidatus Neomarinimicrobiota bacterium]